MKRHAQLMRQIVLFGVVGVATLGIDISVTTIMFNVLHLPAYLSSAIGFMSGFFFNFPINRKKVFHHSEHDKFSLHTQIVMFVSLSVFNLLATSGMVQVLVATGLRIQYAKLVVTAVIAVWNFLLFKIVIFSKHSRSADLNSSIIQ